MALGVIGLAVGGTDDAVGLEAVGFCVVGLAVWGDDAVELVAFGVVEFGDVGSCVRLRRLIAVASMMNWYFMGFRGLPNAGCVCWPTHRPGTASPTGSINGRRKSITTHPVHTSGSSRRTGNDAACVVAPTASVNVSVAARPRSDSFTECPSLK